MNQLFGLQHRRDSMNGWMHIEAKESQALSRKRKAEVSFLMKKDAKLFVNITKES